MTRSAERTGCAKITARAVKTKKRFVCNVWLMNWSINCPGKIWFVMIFNDNKHKTKIRKSNFLITFDYEISGFRLTIGWLHTFVSSLCWCKVAIFTHIIPDQQSQMSEKRERNLFEYCLTKVWQPELLSIRCFFLIISKFHVQSTVFAKCKISNREQI